jgi:hypothetical protein
VTPEAAAGRLEEGVAACLSDPDPFARSQALMFFLVLHKPG